MTNGNLAAPVRLGDFVYYQGHKLVRVTTVCDMVHKNLVPWAAKEAFQYGIDHPTHTSEDALEHIYGKRDLGGIRGTFVHGFVDGQISGQPITIPEGIPDDFIGPLRAAKTWLEDVQPIVYAHNLTVASLKYKFGGTLDILYRKPTDPIDLARLGDFKTGKILWENSTGRQTSAYEFAAAEMGVFKQFGIKRVKLEGIHLKFDGLPTVHPLSNRFNSFICALGIWNDEQI